MTYDLKNVELWLYPAPEGAWHFVTIPRDISEEISAIFHEKKASFGSIRTTVTVGTSTWQTSMFPDKKSGCFLLPIKAAVRKKERLEAGDKTDLTLQIET